MLYSHSATFCCCWPLSWPPARRSASQAVSQCVVSLHRAHKDACTPTFYTSTGTQSSMVGCNCLLVLNSSTQSWFIVWGRGAPSTGTKWSGSSTHLAVVGMCLLVMSRQWLEWKCFQFLLQWWLCLSFPHSNSEVVSFSSEHSSMRKSLLKTTSCRQ